MRTIIFLSPCIKVCKSSSIWLSNVLVLDSLTCDVQIAEVVNSMKDLMDFCSEHKAGSIGKYICFFL